MYLFASQKITSYEAYRVSVLCVLDKKLINCPTTISWLKIFCSFLYQLNWKNQYFFQPLLLTALSSCSGIALAENFLKIQLCFNFVSATGMACTMRPNNLWSSILILEKIQKTKSWPISSVHRSDRYGNKDFDIDPLQYSS